MAKPNFGTGAFQRGGPNFDVGIHTRDFMNQVSSQISEELNERLQFWAKNANRSFERKQGMENLHQDMANRIHSHVVQAYESTRISRGKGYRQGDPDGKPGYRRFSGGAMLRTLKNPELITYDRNGIYLYDRTVLDAGAAQWYRLNFGAKPRGQASAGPKKPMRFFGVDTGVRVNLDRFGPSKAFAIPPGYWSSTKAATTRGTRLRAGNSAFYPLAQNPIPSAGMKPRGRQPGNRGIYGTSFLDKGLTVLNNEYPRRLERLIDVWLKSDL